MAPQAALTPKLSDEGPATAATSPAGKPHAMATPSLPLPLNPPAAFMLRSAPPGLRRPSSSTSLPPRVTMSHAHTHVHQHGLAPMSDAGAAASAEMPPSPLSASNSLISIPSWVTSSLPMPLPSSSLETDAAPLASSLSSSMPIDVVAAATAASATAAATADLARMNLGDDGALDAAQLQQWLQQPETPVIILDMRSFMLYNQAQIKDAINVSVPTTILRRNQFSVALIEQGVSRPADRERWRNRAGAIVVLYEQTAQATQQNVTLVKLFHGLRAEGIVHSVYWLQGGFVPFKAEFPDACKECCPVASKLFRKIDLALACTAPKTANGQAATGPDEPVQIMQYLFLGGEKVASDRAMLHEYGIRRVLNAAVECEDSFPNEFKYLRLDMHDTPSQANLHLLLDKAAAFIDEARDANERVLVHCRAAQSRSVTVVLAYLMRTLHWPLQRAYAYVQKRRPAMSPNLGFMGFLTQYENLLKLAHPSILGTTPPPMTTRLPLATPALPSEATELALPARASAAQQQLLQLLQAVDARSACLQLDPLIAPAHPDHRMRALQHLSASAFEPMGFSPS
jgi:hypothetical protein